MTPRRLTVAAVAVAAVAVAVPAAAYWGFSPSASTTFTAAALANPAQSSVTGVLTAPNASLVSWTAPTNPDGTAFRVTRTTDNTVVCASASTSCADTAPLPGIANTYAVTAVLRTNWVSPAAASTASVTPPDVFSVTGSAAAPTAGSPYPVTIVAKKWSVPANALVTDTAFASTTLTFSGPANGPLGTSPTYPTGPTTFTDGTAFPSVTLRKAETVTLSVSAGSGNTRVFGSGTLNVGPGAASRLAFSTQPTGATTGTAFTTQPVVQVQDLEGNPVFATGNVSLALGNNPASGTLSCTSNPKAAVNGLATFAGCKINNAGLGYTLTATFGSVSATSSSFNVAAAFAITSPVDGDQKVGQKPSLAGTGAAFAGGNVTVTFHPATGADVSRTATVNPDGTWSFSTTTNYLSNGITYTVTATQGSLTSPSITVKA